MAKISKSDQAPDGKVHFTLAAAEFDLDNGGVYKTDDPGIISNATVSPFLTVELDPTDAQIVTVEIDPNDPHDNPASDHLAITGTQAARDAADANETALRDAVAPQTAAPRDDNPTVAESAQATFDSIGVEESPSLPAEDTTTAEAPQPKPRGGDTRPPVEVKTKGDDS